MAEAGVPLVVTGNFVFLATGDFRTVFLAAADDDFLALAALGGALCLGAGESVELAALTFNLFFCSGVMGGDLGVALCRLGEVMLSESSLVDKLRFLTGFLTGERDLADSRVAANSSLPSSLKPALTMAFLKRVLTLL